MESSFKDDNGEIRLNPEDIFCLLKMWDPTVIVAKEEAKGRVRNKKADG